MGNAAPITFRTSARSGGGRSASRLRSGTAKAGGRSRAGPRALPRAGARALHPGPPLDSACGSCRRPAPLQGGKATATRGGRRTSASAPLQASGLHASLARTAKRSAPGREAGRAGRAAPPLGDTFGRGSQLSHRRQPASGGQVRPSGSDTLRRSRALPGSLGGCEHPRHLLPPVPACGGHAASTGTGSARCRPPHGLPEGRARRAPPELSRDFRRREASPAQTVLPRDPRKRVPASPARPA